jgi:hypothetical protein
MAAETTKTTEDIRKEIEGDEELQALFLDSYGLDSLDQATQDNWDDVLDWYNSL